ncbi:hypothetical protein TNCV_2305781 [Trichonephila clavipes]|nr:hypothetical protein TNCV_2305781 [Trichonephila clavipes]
MSSNTAVQDCQTARVFKWPARSPDLNPNENVGCFGEASAGRNYPATNKKLIRALTEEWDKLPQHWITKYTCGMLSHSTVDISRTGTFL